MSYEGKMARSSLRKNIAYSTELLDMIAPDAELEPWVQDKLSQTDHHIEAVYGYYRFGESFSFQEEEKSYDEGEREEKFMVGEYYAQYFFMCPTAEKLYRYIVKIGASQKLAQQSAQLQDALYYTEHLAVQTGLATQQDVEIAEMLAEKIMMLAEQMQLEKQHEYIQMHVDEVKRVFNGETEESENDSDTVIMFSED